MAQLQIGFTERGDAGLDLSWYDKLNSVDGAVIITKNVTKPAFQEKILNAIKNGHKIILHAGCTGWGGSEIEPNVPPFRTQLDSLSELISKGFPIQNIVLRIDPIIPTTSGLQIVDEVIGYAYHKNILPMVRIRISILDEYPHVRQRLNDRGFASFYGGSFYAPPKMFKDTVNSLSKYDGKLKFYTCAEKTLSNYTDKDLFIAEGCISKKDLDILGIKVSENQKLNGQNRNGCLCLACKKELLTKRHPCAHGCAYCYWKD